MTVEPSLEERLKSAEALLRQLADSVGVNDLPTDPEKAWHFERSLLAHFSDMHRSFHQWNNTAQVLVGLMDRLNATMENSASVSRENREGIQEIGELTRKIEAYARSISNNLGLVTRDKPLLMRDLFWLETNTFELWLIAYAMGESWVFLRGSDDLLKTPTYRGLAMVIDHPLAWGGMLGLTTLGALIAFACRKRSWRMAGAFGMALYFGLSGVMTLYISSSVLGWWPHMLTAFGALWILARGPSDAPR